MDSAREAVGRLERHATYTRADGNGAEVGGVSQDVIDLFSSRAVAVTGELKRLAQEYAGKHGKPPDRRTLWLLHQQAGQNTRRTKSQARRTIAGQTGTAEPTAVQRLAAWEAQTVRREVRALSAVHEQVARFAVEERSARAPAVLDDAAKRTAARIAVAEVQRHHATWSMAQLRFEVHRALPMLEPGADGEAVVTEVARLAVSGRASTEVIQVTAPDITDVTSLGVRASDGGSIYRPPHEERYCMLAHLDTEEQILTAAKRTVPQLVGAEQARAAVGLTSLNDEQCEAVVMMLTAVAATTVLIAPAGAGALAAGAAAQAAGCPARRARHRRAHRADHRRPDGRRPVGLQCPARPPLAPATASAGTRRDVGAADAGQHTGAGSRAGRRAR